MGFLKSMKDMKQSVEAAPDMIRQARALGAQGQELAAAQWAAATQPGIAGPPSLPATATASGIAGDDLAPIAGVSVELYADISRGLSAHGYDQSKILVVAAANGVSQDSWAEAMDGWNERMKRNPAVAREFNRLYTGR